MRSAHFNVALYTNPSTRNFMTLSTGSEFCAEHEGFAPHLARIFGSKPLLSFDKLCSGEFCKEDFLTGLEDFLVDNQELLVFAKMSIPVPGTFFHYNDRYHVIKAEIDQLLQQLENQGTPFVVESNARQLITMIVTRKHFMGASYLLAYGVDCYNEKHGTKLVYEEIRDQFQACAHAEDNGVFDIKDPVLSEIVMNYLHVSPQYIANLRDFLLLQHARKHGLEAPALTRKVLNFEPDIHKRKDFDTAGYVASSINSQWHAPWSERDSLRLMMSSYDPNVEKAFEQLFKAYRTGKLMATSEYQFITKGGTGICFVNYDECAESTRSMVKTAYGAYRDAMVALQDANFFKDFHSKVQALSSVVKLSIRSIGAYETVISCYDMPSEERRCTATILNSTLLAWFKGEISDVEMLSLYFPKK